MKKLWILGIMGLVFWGTCFAADTPPEVIFKLQMKADPYGGSAVSYEYSMTCEPAADCFIVDQDKYYLPKVGEVYFIEFCNSWGMCTKLLFTPEE